MKKLLFISITIFTLFIATSSANANFVDGFCKVNKNASLAKLSPSQGALIGKDLFVQERILNKVGAALISGQGLVTEAFVRPRCVVGGKVYKRIGNVQAHVVDSYHRLALAVDITPKSTNRSGWNKLATLAASLRQDPSVSGVIFKRYSHLHVEWK